MLIQHFFTFKSFSANFATEFFDVFYFDFAAGERFFLLFGVLPRQLLPMQPQFLRLRLPLRLFLFLNFSSFFFFFLLPLQGKFLISGIEFFQSRDQIPNGFIESSTLLISFFFVLDFDQPLDSPIRRLIRIINIRIRKWLASGEMLP